MPCITFDSPASGSCYAPCLVVCSGEHDLGDRKVREIVAGYKVRVAYKKSTDATYGSETDGTMDTDGTWSWTMSAPIPMPGGPYDFRARLYQTGMPDQLKDEEVVTGVKVCCTDPIGDDPPVEVAKATVANHHAVTRCGWFNPARGNYMVGVVYSRERPSSTNPDPDWVPSRYDRAELTCVSNDRVKWRMTFFLPGPGRYLLHKMLIRNPGEVVAFTSEIVVVT